jgi:dUTPase
MKIKVINKLKNQLPEYYTSALAGIDFRANLKSGVILKPRESINTLLESEQGSGGFGHTGKR